MTSRQSRSSSIPIPRAVPASPTRERNIEAVISMPFSASSVSPSTSTIHASRSQRLSGHGLPPIRAGNVDVGGSAGRRSSTGVTAAGMSPTRPTARSFTLSSSVGSGSWARGSPRSQPQPAFEPRVIRADSSSGARGGVGATGTSSAIDCLPSSSTTSTSPTRVRRPSGATARAASLSRPSSSSVPQATQQNPSQAFPRPSYLNHSSLRNILHTEASPTLPPGRNVSSGELHAFLVRNSTSGGAGRSSLSPGRTEDSDEDSNATPPPPIRGAGVEGRDREMSGEVLKLPTRWSEGTRHPSLSVSADGRELTFNGPSSNGDKDAAAARTDHSIPPACGIYYYEVEILSKGQKGHISIGYAAGDVKLSRLPGWEKNSWGYHGDDGYSFAAEKNGTPYGPKFGTGDVVGCGVDFSLNRAFYTKNGTFLGNVFQQVGSLTAIYPSVGLRHSGEAVRVNFGHEPFKYDIEDHVLQARNQTWAGIMNTPLRREFITDDPTVKISAGEASGLEISVGGKGPINQLVLSFLSHHGYAKTARAFQAQCERRGGLGDGPVGGSGSAGGEEGGAPIPVPPPQSHDLDVDMDMDLASPAKMPPAPLPSTSRDTCADSPPFDGWGPGMHDGDIELRTRIVNSVISGDIDTALQETARWHPKVLEREEGLMLFKLRCRKFVELILEAAELKKRMRGEEVAVTGIREDGGVGDGMDVDEDAAGPSRFAGTESSSSSSAIPIKVKRKQSVSSPHPGWTGAALAQYEAALSSAISYGQTLQSDYKTDSRPEVQAIFKRTFGVVAYEDPLGAGGEAAEVAGHEARIALATELNQDILRSQGRPTHPTLERLYRQTAACIMQLGMLGVGAAAFADMPKEFLDA